jgi:DNA-binding beta-propeller fold protein YncE
MRKTIYGGICLALLLTLFATRAGVRALPPDVVEAPIFEVDPLWPQPLPNNWLLGSAVGVGVDSRDHVFVIHRRDTFSERNELGAYTDPPTGECCVPAPEVLEFDPDGNLVNWWGGPGEGYVWPTSNHGITVDHLDNVWIAGWGTGDSHVLRFTRDGRLLMQVGEPGRPVDSHSRTHFGRPAKVAIDAAHNEAYIADGYGNKRIAVVDMADGRIVRFWGAYGNEPDDANAGAFDPDAPLAQQFRNPVHCVAVSTDGLVYVCDRRNNRIQVFRRDGTFVTERLIAPRTLGDGSVWDIAFSHDPEQRFLYVADGKNARVYIVERATLNVLTSFGGGGRQPGQFFGVHSIATDSRGNIFTTETYEGKRVQRFVYRGIGPVRAQHQGPPWPRR